jgi:hypothetical protein
LSAIFAVHEIWLFPPYLEEYLPGQGYAHLFGLAPGEYIQSANLTTMAGRAGCQEHDTGPYPRRGSGSSSGRYCQIAANRIFTRKNQEKEMIRSHATPIKSFYNPSPPGIKPRPPEFAAGQK